MKKLLLLIPITVIVIGLFFFNYKKPVPVICEDKIHIKELIPMTPNNKESWKKAIDFFSSGENIRRGKHFFKEYGIPPSVYLAHAALETGFGNSSLVKKTKNRGNIKTKSKKGIKAYDKIEKSYDRYKIFPSYYEGEKAIMVLLSKYKAIKKVQKSIDYKEWTKALEDSPYSTDKDYEEKINNIIKKFSLYNIDHSVLRDEVIINFNNKRLI